MPGREAEQVPEPGLARSKPALVLVPTPARDDLHARYLELARSVGNRAAKRLLARWRDERGKFYDGARPPDPENWEEFQTKDGQTRFRRKATAPALTPTVTPTATAAVAGPAEPARTDSDTIFWLEPKDIRYSQDGITPTFANGTKIDDAARALIRDPTGVNRYPALHITQRKGDYISLDNRRLWVFKHAGVTLCPVVWADAEEMRTTKHFDSEGGVAIIGIRQAAGLSTTNLVLPQITRGFKKKHDDYRYV